MVTWSPNHSMQSGGLTFGLYVQGHCAPHERDMSA